MTRRELTDRLLSDIHSLDLPPVSLMEVCGTHTMAIARYGIKRLLPPQVKLLSGPGCPVCVTPAEAIDAILELAMEPGVVIASYGDMIRVPGSRPGDSLAARRALGADVRMVFSPMDALAMAEAEPGKQFVFLGVGFETTAAGTAAAVKAAAAGKRANFSIFPLLRRVEPALRQLLSDPGFSVDGFLCPGHVAVILGEEGFRYLPEEYRVPAVIAGFEPEEILLAVFRLLTQLQDKNPRVENCYPRAVRPEGNPLARKVMDEVLIPSDELWRGLGMIPGGGYTFREDFSAFDARKRFGIRLTERPMELPCRCGEILSGKLTPEDCPLFGTVCTPDEPVGPCMVSGEGSCAAAYKYRGLD